MVSSRTGLTPHLTFRKRVLTRDQQAGVTHCPECGTQLDYNNTRQPNSAEPDHITPITLGGTNHPDNGRTICRRCNQSKGNRERPTRQPEPPKPTYSSPDW